MKTADALVTDIFLASLLINYKDQFHLIKATEFGLTGTDKTPTSERNTIYQVLFSSDKLPNKGYHGQMDISYKMYDLSFTKDCDV